MIVLHCTRHPYLFTVNSFVFQLTIWHVDPLSMWVVCSILFLSLSKLLHSFSSQHLAFSVCTHIYVCVCVFIVIHSFALFCHHCYSQRHCVNDVFLCTIRIYCVSSRLIAHQTFSSNFYVVFRLAYQTLCDNVEQHNKKMHLVWDGRWLQTVWRLDERVQFITHYTIILSACSLVQTSNHSCRSIFLMVSVTFFFSFLLLSLSILRSCCFLHSPFTPHIHSVCCWCCFLPIIVSSSFVSLYARV